MQWVICRNLEQKSFNERSDIESVEPKQQKNVPAAATSVSADASTEQQTLVHSQISHFYK